jgi:NAD(P)-dependent dehydrogenase (short-subunit alcohol dehydrogenase family)
MATVLITGTNRGIGLEFAKQYASDGWKVHATVRSDEKAAALSDIGGDLHIHILDINKPDEIKKLASELSGEKIDVLIANAGVHGPKAGLGNLERESWLDTFAVNTIGPMLLAEAFLEHVAASDQKKMIAISSIMGSIAENTMGGNYIYRSSKSALNSAWRSLALEIRDRGIIATAFHPGWVRTDMGGPNASIDTTESVTGLRNVISNLTPDMSGRFFDYTGKELPW